MVCSAVVGAQPGAVQAECDRQVLQAYVMHCTVVGALHESGINGGNRLKSFASHSGCENCGVFFSYADIEELSWKFVL